jgi:hypothetical protein
LKTILNKFLFTGICLLVFQQAFAQRDIFGDVKNRIPQAGGGQGVDSVKKRNKFEDSITITYRYLDTSGRFVLDSSIADYNKVATVPYYYHWLGNLGSPAQSMLFLPSMKAGFDAGFHAYDAYKWKLENARFFTTTRPYTELGYVLGSKLQQVIEVMHTQNPKPYWNIHFQYRLINSPGFLKNQNTGHNNYLFTSWYQSPAKRYNNYFIALGNKLQAAENGGIRSGRDYLHDPLFTDPFSIPMKIGNEQEFSFDFFGADINTGTKQSLFNFLLRQQYDFGKKDSLVTDSTVIPLFYPRLRLEHSFTYGEYKYGFFDNNADSVFYDSAYHYTIRDNGTLWNKQDTLYFRDKWNEFKNDFSIYQFPDAKNLNQFVKAGISSQIMHGRLRKSVEFVNVSVHGEYRNLTRNKKWDAQAAGEFYLSGYNAADYQVKLRLRRLLSTKLGSLEVGFENTNRQPPFTFDEKSNFYLAPAKKLFKENITHFSGRAINPKWKIQLGADYYLVTNYLYFTEYYKPSQENDVFSFLRLSGLKTFPIGRHWNWHAELYLQQLAGNAELHLPLVFTRNRIEYEGNFGFKNLVVAFGGELRYHTPYKIDNYSPAVGQFSYQDSTLIKNRPEFNAFFNFRIRSFKAYVRAENLNSFGIRDGAGFKDYNLAAPDYPYPGLVLRFGVYWSFVN